MEVKVMHHSIGSHESWKGPEHRKVSSDEGLNDYTTWTELDERQDSGKLNSQDLMKTLEISDSEEAIIIHLCQANPNHEQSHHLVVSAFEVLGMQSDGWYDFLTILKSHTGHRKFESFDRHPSDPRSSDHPRGTILRRACRSFPIETASPIVLKNGQMRTKSTASMTV
jgi:hypothetical protein